MRKSAHLTSKARSLALNVHFKHPDLGMKDYEILSRATAFLLSVDPPNPNEDQKTTPYSHLKEVKRRREDLLRNENYIPEPAGGPPRHAKDLGWLEFCPGTFRPLVHVVAASHVLSPWMWKNYYPQPWLEHLTQDHVRYSLDVYDFENRDDKKKNEPLATFGVNPYPIHHPEKMDLALVHLKSEEAALKQMESLGVESLHLTDIETVFDKNDEVSFEGFEITEDHYEAMEKMNDEFEKVKEKSQSDDDTRVFVPYNIRGNLIFASQDRFLAKTATPLPEGVCGGPVLDKDNRVCGIVEGIVPVDHPEKEMAGAASFIPYFRLRHFVDFAEQHMLEKIVPKQLYDKVVDLKSGKALNEKSQSHNISGDTKLAKNQEESMTMDRAYEEMVEVIRQTHSPEQVEAIIGTVEREREEVLDLLDKEGGDVDEVIAKVRAKTREKQRQILLDLEEGKDIEEIEEVKFSESGNDSK